jgi:hypothetical protein
VLVLLIVILILAVSGGWVDMETLVVVRVHREVLNIVIIMSGYRSYPLLVGC